MAILTLVSLLLTACSAENMRGNYTDEMKIPHVRDLSGQDGADSVERSTDHKDSPYFSTVDFYNAKSTDDFVILSKFKTQQQSSEWSCGITSLLMVLNHYNILGDWNEYTLAELRPQGLTPEGTSLSDLVEVVEQVGGFEIESSKDFKSEEELQEKFTLDYIQENLKEGTPIIIGWNDWGGHWQVIIGYDTMGTESTQDDVLIVADAYDTTDHNQDGYGVYPAERFYYNFNFYNFFEELEGENNNFMQYLIIKPI
ncbi:cysteine peptidase family C39 domain-containing protein [Anaerosphaera multitolerans]|uniref:cysteine peptidase family C39 domain-containing protein n=1 Tax=Anaerosphaera multitolerans TaxID=2487351 RepID=UPI00196A7A41|nr:cysteine peptidase family C39 domain-containing protein [Anaerosphaera multitolerans]